MSDRVPSLPGRLNTKHKTWNLKRGLYMVGSPRETLGLTRRSRESLTCLKKLGHSHVETCDNKFESGPKTLRAPSTQTITNRPYTKPVVTKYLSCDAASESEEDDGMSDSEEEHASEELSLRDLLCEPIMKKSCFPLWSVRLCADETSFGNHTLLGDLNMCLSRRSSTVAPN
jgi:hypothetical protein